MAYRVPRDPIASDFPTPHQEWWEEWQDTIDGVSMIALVVLGVIGFTLLLAWGMLLGARGLIAWLG